MATDAKAIIVTFRGGTKMVLDAKTARFRGGFLG